MQDEKPDLDEMRKVYNQYSRGTTKPEIVNIDGVWYDNKECFEQQKERIDKERAIERINNNLTFKTKRMIEKQNKTIHIVPSVKLSGGYVVTLSTIEEDEKKTDEVIHAKDLLEVTFLIANHVQDETFLSGIKENRKVLEAKRRSKPRW